jgi:hypothetical protein
MGISLAFDSANSAAGSDPATITSGEEPYLPRVGFTQLATPEGDRPFSIAIGVDPAHRSGVPLAIQMLQLSDQRSCAVRRRAANRGGRM